MPMLALLRNRSRGAQPPPSPESTPGLLCVAQSFPPATTPTAIRSGALLRELSARWEVTVLTETPQPQESDALHVEVLAGRRPRRLLAALQRWRLGKLTELLVWPDESIFWVLPAIRAGRRLARATRPSAIVVFMMPYSAGLVGLALRRLTGLPLILNLDDSPTCSDMHPEFPSALHHRLAVALEDRYARGADATIYVSQTNLEAVRERAPEPVRERLKLVRYGAEARRFERAEAPAERFEIAYVGAMSGWWALIEQHSPPPGIAKRLYEAWMRLGRHRVLALDPRSSSPAVLGHAMLAAIAEHPQWAGWLRLVLYGNPYPDAVVQRALQLEGLREVVDVLGPAPHEQVPAILARADLLFIALPKRLDGSRGGRISAKTYEYLMTDRPILAAVPRGENWDYLAGKPGVWLVEPDDEAGMLTVLSELAVAKAAGTPLTYDRERLRGELSYSTRAREFEAVLDTAIRRRHGAGAA